MDSATLVPRLQISRLRWKNYVSQIQDYGLRAYRNLCSPGWIHPQFSPGAACSQHGCLSSLGFLGTSLTGRPGLPGKMASKYLQTRLEFKEKMSLKTHI